MSNFRMMIAVMMALAMGCAIAGKTSVRGAQGNLRAGTDVVAVPQHRQLMGVPAVNSIKQREQFAVNLRKNKRIEEINNRRGLKTVVEPSEAMETVMETFMEDIDANEQTAMTAMPNEHTVATMDNEDGEGTFDEMLSIQEEEQEMKNQVTPDFEEVLAKSSEAVKDATKAAIQAENWSEVQDLAKDLINDKHFLKENIKQEAEINTQQNLPDFYEDRKVDMWSSEDRVVAAKAMSEDAIEAQAWSTLKEVAAVEMLQQNETVDLFDGEDIDALKEKAFEHLFTAQDNLLPESFQMDIQQGVTMNQVVFEAAEEIVDRQDTKEEFEKLYDNWMNNKVCDMEAWTSNGDMDLKAYGEMYYSCSNVGGLVTINSEGESKSYTCQCVSQDRVEQFNNMSDMIRHGIKHELEFRELAEYINEDVDAEDMTESFESMAEAAMEMRGLVYDVEEKVDRCQECLALEGDKPADCNFVKADSENVCELKANTDLLPTITLLDLAQSTYAYATKLDQSIAQSNVEPVEQKASEENKMTKDVFKNVVSENMESEEMASEKTSSEEMPTVEDIPVSTETEYLSPKFDSEFFGQQEEEKLDPETEEMNEAIKLINQQVIVDSATDAIRAAVRAGRWDMVFDLASNMDKLDDIMEVFGTNLEELTMLSKSMVQTRVDMEQEMTMRSSGALVAEKAAEADAMDVVHEIASEQLEEQLNTETFQGEKDVMSELWLERADEHLKEAIEALKASSVSLSSNSLVVNSVMIEQAGQAQMNYEKENHTVAATMTQHRIYADHWFQKEVNEIEAKIDDMDPKDYEELSDAAESLRELLIEFEVKINTAKKCQVEQRSECEIYGNDVDQFAANTALYSKIDLLDLVAAEFEHAMNWADVQEVAEPEIEEDSMEAEMMKDSMEAAIQEDVVMQAQLEESNVMMALMGANKH